MAFKMGRKKIYGEKTTTISLRIPESRKQELKEALMQFLQDYLNGKTIVNNTENNVNNTIVDGSKIVKKCFDGLHASTCKHLSAQIKQLSPQELKILDTFLEELKDE